MIKRTYMTGIGVDLDENGERDHLGSYDWLQ